MRALLLALLLSSFLVAPAEAQSSCSQSLQSLIDAAPSGGTVLAPACTYHENLWIGKPITLDGQNAATITGDNVRDRWVQIYSSGVVIRNFRMLDAATASQEGAICTCLVGATGIVIDRNDLGPTTNGAPIGSGGTVGTRITNNSVHGGGQMGIGSWQDTDVLIQGNHVYGNNTAGVDVNWAAGGMKVMNGSAKILNNEVNANIGPGIWIDIQESAVAIRGNNVHDQAYNPIFYEVSTNADISDNTVSASNTGAGNWGCIISSSSGNVNIHDNVCQDTLPLRAQLDNRPDVPPGAGHNVVLQNNTLVRPVPPQATSWWQWDPSGPLIPGTNGNVDSGNVLVSSVLPTPTPTATPHHRRKPR